MNFAMLRPAFLLTITLAAASTAHAAPITIPNFSFEEEETDGDNAARAPIAGWEVKYDSKIASGAVSMDPGTEFDGAKGRRSAPRMHGSQIALLFKPCSIQSEQPLTMVRSGVTYTLKVAIGDPHGDSTQPGQLQAGFLIGDASTATSTETFEGTGGTPKGTFDDYTFSYTATEADARKPLKIIFATLSDDALVALDNFRLEEG